jgi:ketosteroid isomerase-like protein
MVVGARTPEELDALYEDAFVVRDSAELCSLYTDGAVVAVAGGEAARGGEAIAAAISRLWAQERTYLAGARRVLQSRDLALLIADGGLHVLRRGGDGAWRAAISLLDPKPTDRRTP